MSLSTTSPASLPAKSLLIADVLHMLVAGWLLNLFLFVGTEVPFFFQMLITTLIMVVIVRGGAWLVFGAMQVSMFFYETRSDAGNVQLSTIFFAVFCLAFVAYAAGFRTIRRWLRNWLARLIESLRSGPPARESRSVLVELDAQQDKLANWIWLRKESEQLLWRGLRLWMIVIGSSIVFLQLPITRSSIQAWWNRTLGMDFMLWPGPNVFTVAVICLLIIAVGSWRTLNPAQASLYLRSFFVREHFRELRSILVRSGQLTESPGQGTRRHKPGEVAAISKGK